MASPPVYQLDANVLLRYLLGDHPTHSPRAASLIQQGNDGDIILEISAVTVAEVFYAMKSFYKFDRRFIARNLTGALQLPAFRLTERARVFEALSRVGTANVDFGDAYLAAAAAETGSPVASFDHDFDRFADITRFEPF